MRVLLLFPHELTLASTFQSGLEQNGCEVTCYSYADEISRLQAKIHTHINKMPYRIRMKWDRVFIDKVNERHLEYFNRTNPDLVILYNSELVKPSTVQQFKHTAKVVYFLGDSPFYTPVYDRYMACLTLADLVLSPDTYWIEQLKMINVKNILFFIPGSNPTTNYTREVTEEEKDRYASDLVFIGQSYSGSWGYKRAALLNEFSKMDIRIFTSAPVLRMYSDFPGLKDKVVLPQSRISHEEHNTILNCCKLYPVDANPGLINGVHIRTLDCIASGIMPIVEYRKDLEIVFQGAYLPVFKTYGEAPKIAWEILRDDQLRKSTLMQLRQLSQEKFMPKITMGNLLENIN